MNTTAIHPTGVPATYAADAAHKPHGYHPRRITNERGRVALGVKQDGVCDVCGGSRWNPAIHPGQRHGS